MAAPETGLDLEVLLHDRLQIDLEKYMTFTEDDGQLIIKLTKYLSKEKWGLIHDLVREWNGKYDANNRQWMIPKIPQQTKEEVVDESHELGFHKANEELTKPYEAMQERIETKLEEETPPEITLSPFNINFDFKDQDHIDLLKKQITNGARLEIVLDEKGEIIDGGHTFVAYQELNLDPLQNAKITKMTFDSDADKIAFSRRRNAVRLQQEPTRYTRSLFQELQLRLNANDDEETKKILNRYRNLKEHPEKFSTETIKEYDNVIVLIESLFETEKIKATSFIANNVPYLDFPDWLADMVDRQELSVSQASLINNSKIAENEVLQKRIANQCIGKTVEKTKALIKAITEFKPELSTTWFFHKASDAFGDPDYPGRCAGQIMQNLLHYWTKEGDIVVDPMAGGGTTVDVCKIMNRNYLAWDIKPHPDYVDDIKNHDIDNGFPEKAKKCDLIFLDPPYFKKKEKEYGKTSVSSLDRKEFLDFMEKLAKASFDTVNPGGFVALLVSDFIDWPHQTHGTILSSEYWKLFKDAGFEDVNRIMTPLPFSSLKAISGHDVDKAKKEKEMINTTRDLYIFRRPTTE